MPWENSRLVFHTPDFLSYLNAVSTAKKLFFCLAQCMTSSRPLSSQWLGGLGEIKKKGGVLMACFPVASSFCLITELLLSGSLSEGFPAHFVYSAPGSCVAVEERNSVSRSPPPQNNPAVWFFQKTFSTLIFQYCSAIMVLQHQCGLVYDNTVVANEIVPCWESPQRAKSYY